MFKQRRNVNSTRRPGGKNRFFKKTHYSTPKKGPAECNVDSLKDHYFDCSGYNEADRYIATKKAIIQYMGTEYGGDIRVTLESGRRFVVPLPPDPASKYTNLLDSTTGAIVETAASQVSTVERKEYDEEIKAYIRR